jgi:hypothetical protein
VLPPSWVAPDELLDEPLPDEPPDDPLLDEVLDDPLLDEVLDEPLPDELLDEPLPDGVLADPESSFPDSSMTVFPVHPNKTVRLRDADHTSERRFISETPWTALDGVRPNILRVIVQASRRGGSLSRRIARRRAYQEG